jgi:hypothetical protein
MGYENHLKDSISRANFSPKFRKTSLTGSKKIVSFEKIFITTHYEKNIV